MNRDFLLTFCRGMASVGVVILMNDVKYASPVFFVLWFVQLLVEERGSDA